MVNLKIDVIIKKFNKKNIFKIYSNKNFKFVSNNKIFLFEVDQILKNLNKYLNNNERNKH